MLFSSAIADAITPSEQQSLYGNSEYYDPGDSCTTDNGASTILTGSDYEQQAYNYFISQGLSATQAASIVGNLMVESSMNPTVIQTGGNTDDPSTVTGPKVGWGIAQWTPGDKVLTEAQQYGVTTPIYELGTQLTIVWDELNSVSLIRNSPPTIKALEQTNTTADGVLAVLEGFGEGPISPPLWPAGTTLQEYENGTDYSTRVADANTALTSYGGSSNNSGSTNSTSVSYNCGSAIFANCNSSTSSGAQTDNSVSNSNLRQELVCLAEAQLQLWQSQPGYNTNNFPYANAGYLNYSQGEYEEWCADFISWIYNQADYPFVADPNWQVAGVKEIISIAQQSGGNFSYHLAGSGYIPQPGDLAIHSFPKRPEGHINMFISSSGGVSTYIGGDQQGGTSQDYPPDPPQSTPGSPPSESIVSTETMDGYWGNSNDTIIGYVSPN